MRLSFEKIQWALTISYWKSKAEMKKLNLDKNKHKRTGVLRLNWTVIRFLHDEVIHKNVQDWSSLTELTHVPPPVFYK